MAVKKPLVINNGTIEQLQSGDSIEVDLDGYLKKDGSISMTGALETPQVKTANPVEITSDMGVLTLTDASNSFVALGSEAITSIAGQTQGVYIIRFSTTRTLTHNGTSLILQGGVDRVTQAGDIGVYEMTSVGARELSYTPATKEWGYITLSANQTSNIGIGNHVQFDTIIGNITLSTGIGQQLGLITLKIGKIYNISTCIRPNFTSDGGFVYGIYDSVDNLLSTIALNYSINRNQVYTVIPHVSMIIKPAANIDIKVRIINISNTNAILADSSYLKVNEV
jgi:hypothetical protein